MSRIQQLFEKKAAKVLNVYCTAGFPYINSTLPVMQALQESGADMIELGMPYSDPLADGPVIQASSTRAIANGMTMKRLFDDLANFRKDIHLPVLLMGYMNPVMQFGFENFCRSAAEVGVDGLILPDLPMFEFENEYGAIIRKYGLDFVFLIAPETSDERIRQLDALSSGFLYAVSSSSTTGNEKALEEQTGYFKKLRDLKLHNPVLVGFGIRDKETFNGACRYASGAIIGTAYIRALEPLTISLSGDNDTATSEEIMTATKTFINGIIG